MAAPTFYNQGDQDIYNSGQHFVPQEKYRLGYTPPAAPEVIAPVPGGITNTNAFTGSGGDNFSVYNPDPNSISNRDYNPRPYYDATYEDTFGANAKDPLSNFTMTGDPEILARGDTGGQFYEPPPSKLEGLMSMLPYAGSFMRGAKFLGNQIGPYLPTNRRSIMENQLSGQGIMVNDIGQIVQGDGAYDTAANVMAGYNANKMTAKTFDDRLASLGNMSVEGREKREAAIKEAKADFLNAQGKTKTIYDFEEEEKNKNKKNTVINRFITKKKEKKAAKDAQAAADAQAAVTTGGTTNSDGFTYDTNTTGQASSNQYGTYTPSVTPQQAQDNQDRGRGQQDTESQTNSPGSQGPGGSDEMGSFARGGRAGYFFGGRVNYKAGGRTDAESQYGEDSAGSYDSSQNKSGRQQSYGGDNNSGARDNPPNFFVEDKTSIVDTSGLKSKSPEINIDYTDPRNYASLKGSIYNTNILDNDDINVDGTLSGEIGPVSYNTNFTDQGITNTNLTAGNFNADIDANKNYSLGYANNYNGIDYGAKYDNNGNLMFSAGVNFKNGGLAGLL